MTVSAMIFFCDQSRAKLTGQISAKCFNEMTTLLFGAVGEMQIDHGGIDVGMTEQGFDGVETGASFDEVGGKTVAQGGRCRWGC